MLPFKWNRNGIISIFFCQLVHVKYCNLIYVLVTHASHLVEFFLFVSRLVSLDITRYNKKDGWLIQSIDRRWWMSCINSDSEFHALRIHRNKWKPSEAHYVISQFSAILKCQPKESSFFSKKSPWKHQILWIYFAIHSI